MLQADAQEAKTAAPNDTVAAPVTANDLYREMRIQAGQYAAQNRHQVLVGDFTCDDINDQIVGWVDRDNPEGPFFDVLMVTIRQWSITFRIQTDPVCAIGTIRPLHRR